MSSERKDGIVDIITGAVAENRYFLYEYEGKKLLELSGVAVARSLLVTDKGQLESVSADLEYPLVLKIVSPQIIHKSDVGAVVLGLNTLDELEDGFSRILKNVETQCPDVKIVGILVQEMAPSSTEVIIGATRDPQFGPTVMFGVGGIMVEILKDVSFRVAPLTAEEAEEMVRDIRSFKILEGARGMPKSDLDAITEIVMKISEIMIDYPEIASIDLNPVLVYESGAIAVDARFILEREVEELGTPSTEPVNLEALLEPKSVAVVGASANPDKIGHKILKNILDGGFQGEVYPINPRGGGILGLRAYTSVLEVPGDVDNAVIVIPARFVLSVVKECVQKGVKGAVIISSGFRDVGPDGAVLEREVLAAAGKGGLRLIGPNCQGVSNSQLGFCATWPLVKDVGDVAVISQSGTIALEIPSFLSRNHLGYSKMVALGNKSDIDEADLISWLGEDEGTKVISVYTEGMENGRKLMRAIENAFPKKPILMLKGGKSEAGKKAVLAHTGSLAGSREVFEAAVEQSGGLCVRDLEELCDAVKAFSTLSVPNGDRLLIITSSGGSGILASDTCEEVGLKLSELSVTTLEKLKQSLPDWCVMGNPLDVTGNALNYVHLYRDALEIALDDDSVDMCLLIFGDPIPDAYESLTEALQKATKKKIPVAVSYLGGANVQIVETQKFQENGVPVYPTPGRAVRALSFLNKYREKVIRCLT